MTEARRRAAEARRARRQSKRNDDDAVVIRAAVPGDERALARLAALEGERAPDTSALVAEVGGQLVAAIGLDGRPALADPFRPTGDVLSLLELRASQLRTAA